MVIICTIINRATSGTIKYWYANEKEDVGWQGWEISDDQVTLTHSVTETNDSQKMCDCNPS